MARYQPPWEESFGRRQPARSPQWFAEDSRVPRFVRRYPTTFLTLVGFRYCEGSHPSDEISKHLLKGPGCNPQLYLRVLTTASTVFERKSRAWEVSFGRDR